MLTITEMIIVIPTGNVWDSREQAKTCFSYSFFRFIMEKMVLFILLTIFKKELEVWFIETKLEKSNLLRNKRSTSLKKNSKETQDEYNI